MRRQRQIMCALGLLCLAVCACETEHRVIVPEPENIDRGAGGPREPGYVSNGGVVGAGGLVGVGGMGYWGTGGTGGVGGMLPTGGAIATGGVWFAPGGGGALSYEYLSDVPPECRIDRLGSEAEQLLMPAPQSAPAPPRHWPLQLGCIFIAVDAESPELLQVMERASSRWLQPCSDLCFNYGTVSGDSPFDADHHIYVRSSPLPASGGAYRTTVRDGGVVTGAVIELPDVMGAPGIPEGLLGGVLGIIADADPSAQDRAFCAIYATDSPCQAF